MASYLPKTVKKFLDQTLLTPSEFFHPELAPQPRIIGVYGREGLKKAQVIEEYLNTNKIQTWNIVCKVGRSTDAVNEMICVHKARAEIPEVSRVLIIENADTLIYDAESAEAVEGILQMIPKCAINDRVICVFDRLPGEQTAVNNGSWFKEKQIEFFKMFDTEVFFPAPPKDFRVAFYKATIENFLQHQNSLDGKLKIDNQLTEDDYEFLANHSQFATQENMLLFLRKPFYHIIYSSAIESVVVNRELFEEFMHNLPEMGGKYIYHLSYHRLEDTFSTALRNGPVVPNLAEIRNEKRREQEKLDVSVQQQQPPGGEIITSGGFTTEGANQNNAEKLIKKKKKKNKKNLKREEEDDDWSCPTVVGAILTEQEYPDPLSGVFNKDDIVVPLGESEAKKVKLTE